MTKITNEKFTNEDGSHVTISSYITYETVARNGNRRSSDNEANIVRLASGQQGNGSGVYHRVTHKTERQWRENQFVKIETEVQDKLNIPEFDEDGKEQNRIYIAKRNCNHVGKGTYTRSWGAGCSYDYSTYCSFCDQVVAGG